MRTEGFKTDEDKKLEILMAMDSSLIEASRLARFYEFAPDLRSSVVFLMRLYKDFHGFPHKESKSFGL
jgi:hypothetical protein